VFNYSPQLNAFPIKGFGGLDTVSPEELVAPNRFVELVDFTTHNNGMLEFRKRVTYMGHAITPISWIGEAVLGDASYILFVSGRDDGSDPTGNLCRCLVSGTDVVNRELTGGERIFLLNSNAPTDVAFFQNYILAANGYTPLYPLPLAGENTNEHYEGIIGKYPFVWRQRLGIANTAANPREVRFSSILRGTSWDSAQYTPLAGDFWEPLGAKSVIVSVDSTEYITGVLIWNGVPVVGTNKGLYRIDTNWGSFPITKETGVRDRTMCLYRGAIIFLGDDDVYMMTSFNEVKPLTRNTIHSTIFDNMQVRDALQPNMQVRDALQPNEWICDTYGDWIDNTEEAPPDNLLKVEKGGYVTVDGLLGNDGARQTDPIQLKNLLPDHGANPNGRGQFSNFIRIDFLMTNSWGELDFFDKGGTSDADFSRSDYHLDVWVKQGATAGTMGAYVELLPPLDYSRDPRALSFVHKIDVHGDDDVFDYWIQIKFKLTSISHDGITANPQVHRMRVSWDSAVPKGKTIVTENYLDYRQQPYACVIDDRYWLHFSGKNIEHSAFIDADYVTGDDSFTFVMDKRGEWTMYRNFDAFAMAEVNLRHSDNQEIVKRFLIGRRWSRYHLYVPEGHQNQGFYVETKEWPDFLAAQGTYYTPAIAKMPKLYFNNLTQAKRLRFLQPFYQGSFGDVVRLSVASFESGAIPAPIYLLYHSLVDSEMISTLRFITNFGTWFQYTFELPGPIDLSQDFKLSQLVSYIQILTARPTFGQPPPASPV